MYSEAETFSGVFTLLPSAHRYSYFGPADIVGQLSGVQNSVKIPYSTLTVGTHGNISVRRAPARPLTFVVELDCVHGEPLVEVLAARQLDGELHVPHS